MTEDTAPQTAADSDAIRQMEQRLDAVGEYFRSNILTQILRDLDDVDALVTRMADRIQRELAGQIVQGLAGGNGLEPSRGESLSGLAELLGRAQRYL